MQLTNEHITLYIKAYRKVYGREIDKETAMDYASRSIRFLHWVYKPELAREMKTKDEMTEAC